MNNELSYSTIYSYNLYIWGQVFYDKTASHYGDFALTHSIHNAAFKLQCSRNTVRKWGHRYHSYQDEGIKESQMKLEDARPPTTNHPLTLPQGTQQRLYRILEQRYNNHLRIIISHLIKNHHFSCSLATARKYANRWGFFHSRHNQSRQK